MLLYKKTSLYSLNPLQDPRITLKTVVTLTDSPPTIPRRDEYHSWWAGIIAIMIIAVRGDSEIRQMFRQFVLIRG